MTPTSSLSVVLITRIKEIDDGSLVTQWIFRKFVTTLSMLNPL